MDTVALPIENQVNGVDRMLYMQSTSAPDGTYSLTVTFAIGTDPNIDQVLVQNRVQLALASLPEPVQAQGVSVQKKNTAILQIVTLDSPDHKFDSLYMSNYATINLIDALARLPGVGSVKVFGAGNYSMRIWMDPQLLQSFGLQPSDVIRAIREQNQNIAAGQVGMPPAPSSTPIPIYRRRAVAARPAGGVRQHRRQGCDRAGRPAHSSARRGADRTRGADLCAGLPG